MTLLLDIIIYSFYIVTMLMCLGLYMFDKKESKQVAVTLSLMLTAIVLWSQVGI